MPSLQKNIFNKIKKTRKKPITPRSQIRSALRRLWLRSRERSMALRISGYHCQHCNGKQSKAKGKEFSLEVHHLDGAHMEYIIDEIYKYLLCDPSRLEVLCIGCHKEKHSTEEE